MHHNTLAQPPGSSMPMYYLHSFEQPFCANPLCLCQLHKGETVQVFTHLIEGKLLLEQAQPLLAERTV